MPIGQLRDQQWKVPQSPWSHVFGDPRGTDSSIYDVSDRTTWTMPDAYTGRSKKLSDTIERMVFTDDNWYLKEIMPFEIVQDANSVTWNEVRFDPHLTTPVPELGTVRLVKSERKQNTASWIRWGIGYYMEHGFMNTPEGIQYHIEHLQQMASAALETAKFDVIYTLLQAHDMEKRWEIEHGRFKGRRVDDLLSKDIWMFAALQKYKRPINQLETYVNETMSKYGGRADSWILPPQVINYMGIVPDEYLEQRKIGAVGPQIVMDGPRPYGMIAQNRVFIARTYHTAQFTGRENILEHQREIGEYYKMFDRNPDNCAGYCSRDRHTQIYNEDNNSWWEVSLRWALDHSQLFNPDGSPRNPDDGEYQDRLTGPDADLDVFGYLETDRNGQTRASQAKVFGELPDFYFTARDKIGWAGTVRQAMQRDYGESEFKDMERDFNAGVDLLQEIDSLGWTQPDEDEIMTRFGNVKADGNFVDIAGNAVVGPNPRTDNPTVHAVTEFVQDETFIAGTGGDAGKKLKKLLPGLQSEPGLRYIAKNAHADLAKEKEKASNFLSAVRKIVRALRKYSYRSGFLDRKNASSWFHTPTDETTFVENLVMPYRPPTFMRAAAVGGANAGDLQTGANVNFVQRGVAALRRNVPANIAVTNTVDKDGSNLDKVGWFRYWATTAVAAMARNTAAASRAAFRDAFGASNDTPMKIDFSQSFGGSTVDEELNNIVDRIMSIQKATNGQAFSGIDSEQTAAEVLHQIREHFSTEWQKTQESAAAGASGPIRAAFSDAELAKFYRTPLLSSPNFAADLYAQHVTGGLTGLLPAHPDFPEVPVDQDTLDRYTRHNPRRPGSTEEARQPRSLLDVNPAWVSTVSEQVHGAESATFLANALALEIGHSMDSADFSGVQVASQLLGAESRAQPTRRSGKANTLKQSVAYKRLLDPYQRRGLSGAAEAHIATADLFTNGNFQQSWTNLNELASSPLDRAIAHVFDTIPINYQAFSRFIDNDLRFPISFYITRPHMTYRMLYGIKCLAGKEMGMTLMKPGLFEIGDDAATQAHIGTYTYYSKALVKNHNHVYIAKSIFCNGYDGGSGIHAINPLDYQAANGNYTGQSIIVLAVPYRDEVDGILSLTGRLTLGEYEDYDLTVNGDLQYVSAKRYNRLYGWNFARVDDQFETQPYDGILERRFNNVLCHQGHQFFWNRTTQSFTFISEGKGHFGPHTYLGCDKARAGLNVEFKTPDWAGYVHV